MSGLSVFYREHDRLSREHRKLRQQQELQLVLRCSRFAYPWQAVLRARCQKG